MVKSILRKCSECRQYTLQMDQCPSCGGKLRIPHPAKFSLDDKYLKYRTRNRVSLGDSVTEQPRQ
ncbi:MAG: RNA-protein complex protein Nop10 [Candidatus Bathyarchaeota archaeon]|nr:MAG: RNA-protein complex protein Nop10 [Candidatus Bathyarchaeota archaeon]